MFRGSSRINRTPRDSLLALSELFDIGLKKCGMTALRSNSIFITNDKEHCTTFGDPFIIFPINGFEYTFTKFNDLTFTRYGFEHEWANSKVFDIINQAWKNEANKVGIFKQHEQWTFDLIKKFTNLSYLIEEINKLLTTPINPEDLVDLNKFESYFIPQNVNLRNVLINNISREVMIKGSYYALNAEHFIGPIKEKLRQ